MHALTANLVPAKPQQSATNKTDRAQSIEKSSPHTTRPAQQAVASLDAPLVEETVVLAVLVDDDATTNPDEAAVTSCPSTVCADPPAVNVAVYTAKTPEEISLAVKISDSKVTVCTDVV